MRTMLLVLMGATIVSAPVGAQPAGAAGAQAGNTTLAVTNSQVAVQAFVDPEVVAPSSVVTLTFAVTPARGIHVYAPGATYQVVAVKLDPQAGVKPADVTYPPSEIYYFAPLDEQVPVYQKPFTLKQAVRVSAGALKGKETLRLSGKLEYQACDDRVCFKPNAIPFAFELKVKR